MRIVSLLPSATEIICSLGLREHLVGVSHECNYPGNVQELPTVTRSNINTDQSSREIDTQVREQLRSGTALYTLDLDLLKKLKPDLIVTQSLCNVCAVSIDDVETALHQLPGQPQIINLEPSNLDDIFKTIKMVGSAAQRGDVATRLDDELRQRIQRVRQCVASFAEWQPRVAQLEWLDPLFSAGHWTPELIDLAGAISVTGTPGEPSRTLDWSELVDSRPEVIFVACCGLGVERTMNDIPLLLGHPSWQAVASGLRADILVADGDNYFNRPGPRLVDSLEIIADALHPRAGILPDGAKHRAVRLTPSAATSTRTP